MDSTTAAPPLTSSSPANNFRVLVQHALRSRINLSPQQTYAMLHTPSAALQPPTTGSTHLIDRNEMIDNHVTSSHVVSVASDATAARFDSFPPARLGRWRCAWRPKNSQRRPGRTNTTRNDSHNAFGKQRTEFGGKGREAGWKMEEPTVICEVGNRNKNKTEAF